MAHNKKTAETAIPAASDESNGHPNSSAGPRPRKVRIPNGWRLIDEAEAEEAEAEEKQKNEGARLNVADLFRKQPPVDWVCEDIELAAGAPSLLAGLGFSGKSLLAQDLALAVASGGMAWEAFQCRPGRVVHFDYEQGARLTIERYQRLAAARGISPEDLEDRLSCLIFPGFRLDDANVEGLLCRELEGARLAIVDSFRASAPKTDENSSVARVPLDMLGRVSDRTGAAILVIHHARKPASDDLNPSRHAVRGSSAIFDACQCVMVATPASEERTDSEGKTRAARPALLSIEKARLSGRSFGDPITYSIEDVEIGNDARGGITVCAEPPQPKWSLSVRLEGILGGAGRPMTARSLRESLKCSNAAFKGAIASLARRVKRVELQVNGRPYEGYTLVS